MDALSVYHARSLEGYRQTLELRVESATTEQLREAMIRYRALFEDLTGLRDDRGEPERDRVAEIRDRAAVAGNSTPTAETAEPPAADSELAARNSNLAAEGNTSRTADTPR